MAASGLLRLWQGYKDGQETDPVKKAWTALCKRNYHVHCKIINQTDKEIRWTDDTYFDSGRMYIAPPNSIMPKSSVTFGVGGGSYSGNGLRSALMGGVSGGARLQINGGPAFAIGFTDPVVGSRKAGATMLGSAKDGYNAAGENGGSSTNGGYGVEARIDSSNRTATYTVVGPF